MFKLRRPTVRRDPPDDGVELRVTEDDASSKGAKRKRALPQGPCEHGRVRSKCKEAVGAQSVSTVAAPQVQGVRWGSTASTVVAALGATSAVVHQSASTVVGALSARSAVGLDL